MRPYDLLEHPRPSDLTIIPRVRIAFSGSHWVGKSTLVEQVAQALPPYAAVEEPYQLLEEDGYEFGWPPSAEDFEAQLDRSVLEIATAGNEVLFDRCPVDFLAYLLVDGQDIERKIERAREAVELLDLGRGTCCRCAPVSTDRRAVRQRRRAFST